MRVPRRPFLAPHRCSSAALASAPLPRPSAASIDWNAASPGRTAQYALPAAAARSAAATAPRRRCVCCEARTAAAELAELTEADGRPAACSTSTARPRSARSSHARPRPPPCAARALPRASARARDRPRRRFPAHLPPPIRASPQVRLRDAAGGDAHRQMHDQPPRLRASVCVPKPPPPSPPPPLYRREPMAPRRSSAGAVLRGAMPCSSSATRSSRPTAGPTRRSARTPPHWDGSCRARGRCRRPSSDWPRTAPLPPPPPSLSPHCASASSTIPARLRRREVRAASACGAERREGDGRV